MITKITSYKQKVSHVWSPFGRSNQVCKTFQTLNNQICLALPQNLVITLIQKVAPSMRFMKMLGDCRIFVFSNTLEKSSGCVADIICIAQITYKSDKQRIAD